jgi:hypothetical protein
MARKKYPVFMLVNETEGDYLAMYTSKTKYIVGRVGKHGEILRCVLKQRIEKLHIRCEWGDDHLRHDWELQPTPEQAAMLKLWWIMVGRMFAARRAARSFIIQSHWRAPQRASHVAQHLALHLGRVPRASASR